MLIMQFYTSETLSVLVFFPSPSGENGTVHWVNSNFCDVCSRKAQCAVIYSVSLSDFLWYEQSLEFKPLLKESLSFDQNLDSQLICRCPPSFYVLRCLYLKRLFKKNYMSLNHLPLSFYLISLCKKCFLLGFH